MKDNKTISQEFQIDYVTDLSSYRFVQEKIQVLPYHIVKARKALPIDEADGYLLVALEDPLDLETVEEIQCWTEKKVREICAPLEAIEAAIEQCYHQKESAASALIATMKDASLEQ